MISLRRSAKRIGGRLASSLSTLTTEFDHDRDWIYVKNLSIRTTLGESHWPSPDSNSLDQPISVSFAIPQSLRLAGMTDHLPHSLHYGMVAELVEKICSEKGKFQSMEHMAHEVSTACLEEFRGLEEIRILIEKQRALLQATSAGFESTRRRDGTHVRNDKFIIKDLQLPTIIGIHPWERLEKQNVRINLASELKLWTPSSSPFDYKTLVRKVSDRVSASSYQTVESLVSAITQEALAVSPELTTRVTAQVGKPSALMFAEAPEVQVTRVASDFEGTSVGQPYYKVSSGTQTAVIAFGSNMGNRFLNIERALQLLEADGATKILDTSFLYETDAMYVEDQARFINGACLISTSHDPQSLLKLFKKVEADVGRIPNFKNGPRIVDLDLVFYNDMVYSNQEDGIPKVEEGLDLVIPHERVQEREFVLRPLADIIPKYIHPRINLTIEALLSNLTKSTSSAPRIRKVTPFLCPVDDSQNTPESPESPYLTWTAKTHIMAVINATPDSFSDGGDHYTVSSAMDYVRALSLKKSSREALSCADIIDIGGCSTRPTSCPISEAEEISRIIPIIKAIRNEGIKTLISVDTFRAGVAEVAIKAGANCINDVYGLTGEGPNDRRMLEVTRRLGVPLILMHSRGDAGKDEDYEDIGGVVTGVRKELGHKVDRALKAGVRRWNIIVDPGIGFSKNVDGNLTLLRDLKKFIAPHSPLSPTRSLAACVHSVDPISSMPVLIGASRKSFLGKIIGRNHTVKERSAASLVAHTTAIQQGADIIRAHEAVEAWDMAQVADRVWRSS